MVSTLAGIVHSKLVRFTLLEVLIFLCLMYTLRFNRDFTSPDFEVNKSQMQRKSELSPFPECNCSSRSYHSIVGQAQTNKLRSSCSDPGTFFQPSQKVVSYSLYIPKYVLHRKRQERQSLYIEGILENLRTMRLYYPTYTMRVYTDVRTDPQFCSIICNNSDLFWCDIQASPIHGNLSQVNYELWRFLPLGDPTVDHFLSRDLDSILSEREAAVIADWLSLPEKKAIHIMRDKKEHNAAIPAGMWGAINPLFEDSGNESAVSILAFMLNAGTMIYSKFKGFDQYILKTRVFYPLKDNIVSYDSYHCERWRKYTLVRPFPIKRKNNSTDFVGNVDLGRQVYRLEKCPVECRPAHGKDWEWC